jgi:hypothetical protein
VPSNLLVLALLAGFCFVHACNQFKFRAQMLDGYRLLFHCSVAGAALLAASRVLISLAKLLPWFWVLRPRWNQIVDVPYFGTFALSIPLAYLAAMIWNMFTPPEEERERAVRAHGTLFMLLLHEAINEAKMVSITLESRKWYAGYVAEAPNLRPSEIYFNLLPILSGYRDKDTLQAKRKLAYDELYNRENVNPADFVITLPIASVRSASFFDPDVYNEHFSEREDAEPVVAPV